MKEARGNLWSFPGHKVITTNGFVKKSGECVMGRGCAKEAADMFPHLPIQLGECIGLAGNHVYWFSEYDLITFPVKHNWFEKADINLIRRSARELNRLADKIGGTFVLPRPGCGNGLLDWEQVKPILQFLDDNFLVVTY